MNSSSHFSSQTRHARRGFSPLWVAALLVILPFLMNKGAVPVASGATSAALSTARVSNSLQALYNFAEGSGATITDISGTAGDGNPLNLAIENSSFSWNNQQLMGHLDIIDANRASNATDSNKIYDACTTSNELTVEAWITPSEIQGGPARIVTMSNDGSNRNFTLAQNSNDFQVRLRTTTNGNNGTNTTLDGGTAAVGSMVHVVFTRDSAGNAALYVTPSTDTNVSQVDTATIGGDFSNWDANYDFGIANEFGDTNDSGSRNFNGDYHLVGVYCDALSAAEVQQNFDEGANYSTPNEISGVAFDQNNNGISGLTVTAFNGITQIAQDTTDADGKYSFSGLTDSVNYRVVFVPPGTYLPTQLEITATSPATNVNAQFTLASTVCTGAGSTPVLFRWSDYISDGSHPTNGLVMSNIGGSGINATLTYTTQSSDTNYIDSPDTTNVPPYNNGSSETLRWYFDDHNPPIEDVVLTFSEPVLFDELIFGGARDISGYGATAITLFDGANGSGNAVLPNGLTPDSSSLITPPAALNQNSAINELNIAGRTQIMGYDNTGGDAGSYVMIGDDANRNDRPWTVLNYNNAVAQSLVMEHLVTSSTDPAAARDNLSSNDAYSVYVGNFYFTPVACDFGDLPDAGSGTAANDYETLLANNGPRHRMDNVTFLGASVDSETEGQQTASADGDDSNGDTPDDEDGITIPTLTAGQTAVITVTAGSPGYLSSFIDFDGDGTLDPVTLVSATGPAAVTPGVLGDTELSTAGTYQLTITVPSNAVAGDTFSRFRFTANAYEGGNNANGAALSGEVEDHQVTIETEPPAAIGNYVWVDENSDGLQNEGEVGIPNVTVQLKNSSGTVIETTVTDAKGGYLFSDLAPGDYFVDIDESTLPAGMSQTTAYTNIVDGSDVDSVNDDGDLGNKNHSGNGYAVTVIAGEENLTADFGYNYNPTSDVNDGENNVALGDRIWIDSDGNGKQDPSEIGVSGATVTLYHDPDGDGVYDTPYTVGGYTPTTTTDANGYYLFDNLPAGAYVVTVTDDSGASHDILGSGYVQTGDPDHFATSEADNPGTFGEDDNTTTQPIILGPGDVFLNADFGYQPGSAVLNSVGDTIFFDADADGNGPSMTAIDDASSVTQGAGGAADAADYGITGVTVALINDLNGNGDWDNGEPIIATTTTNGDGQYLFQDLPDGNYLVWINDTDNVISGLTQSYDSDGTSSANISAVDLDSAGASGTAVDNRTQDFGYTPIMQTSSLGAIGDTIFIDDTNSGETFDPANDTPLEGVEVVLTLPSGVTITQKTDENGRYYFGGLELNETYTVTVNTATLPGGATVWTNTADPNGDDNNTSVVNLTSGNPINLDQDFGYVPGGSTGSIGNLVWEDTDADGVKDATEGGINGVTLDLYYDANGNGVIDPGEPRVGTTVTSGGGAYLFDNLPINDGGNDMAYVVDVTDRNGVLNGYWHSLSANQDATTNGGNDPADNSKSDSFGVVLSTTTPNNLNVDFGYYKDPAAVGNFVWYDADADGIQDAGENGINGITVTLTIDYPDGTQVTIETVTGDDPSTPAVETGWYSFPNLLSDEDYRTGSGTGTAATNQPAYTISVDTGTYIPTFTNVASGGGNDQNDSDANGVAAIPNQGSQAVTQNADPTAEGNPIATYDFGVVRADLGDLPDSGTGTGANNYNTLLTDGGAAHTLIDANNDGSPDVGQIMLGTTVDSENDGQQSGQATGDGADEDGIEVNLSDWDNGTNGGQVGVTVSGGSGYLVGWIDFDGDGVFDTVAAQAVTAGANTMDVDVPADTFLADGSLGGSNQIVFARFRLFENQADAEAVAGGSAPTISTGFTGLAQNGEVEDFVWTFGPTAVSLTATSVNSHTSTTTPVSLVFIGLLAISGLFLARNRKERSTR